MGGRRRPRVPKPYRVLQYLRIQKRQVKLRRSSKRRVRSRGKNVSDNTLAQIIDRHENELLTDWMQRQKESLTSRQDLVSEAELRTDSRHLLAVLRDTAGNSNADITRPEWAKARELLGDLSRRRVRQGFSPSETATFVFSLKQPLFDRIAAISEGD